MKVLKYRNHRNFFSCVDVGEIYRYSPSSFMYSDVKRMAEQHNIIIAKDDSSYYAFKIIEKQGIEAKRDPVLFNPEMLDLNSGDVV